MVNRPSNWDLMTPTQQTRWLQKNDPSHQAQKGKYKHLTEKDTHKVWSLMRTYKNKSLVAKILGVGRRSLHRFLEKHPIPDTFKLEKTLEDYEEIQTWITRQKAFSKESVIKHYLTEIRKFYNWMLENHPERARPMLWTSDLILEWLNGNESIGWKGIPDHAQHDCLVAVRQLAKKCKNLFPMIELGLLPTRRTHAKRRSLAGHNEYYLDIDPDKSINQVQDLINNVPDETEIEKARNQAIISTLFNLAVRTGNPRTGLGLLGMKIENLHLDQHRVIIKDKHDITWNCLGVADQTIQFLQKYLELRDNPKRGPLWVNGNDRPLQPDEVNKMLKEAGKRAGIKSYDPKTGEGKRLVAKTFRKTLVKYALEILKMNPMSLIGTGKKIKTCFCVGWTSMKVFTQHYAPKLHKTIEQDRQKFAFN